MICRMCSVRKVPYLLWHPFVIFFLHPSPVHRLSGNAGEHSNARATGSASTGTNDAIMIV